MNAATGTGSELRRRIGLVAGPLLALLVLTSPHPEGLDPAAWRVAAVAVLMVVWWITEAIPIPATALLPIVLFPVLQVGSVGDATRPYAHPLIFLFLGGFLIARGMEVSGLHRRIALAILARAGSRPRAILAGFMAAAAFLSMWVSNSATAMMMLPIALSVIALVEGGQARPGAAGFAVALLLGLAWACNVGGLGTLIGTPPNALLAAYLAEQHDIRIGFAQWMAFGVPLAIAGLIVIHAVLTRTALRGVPARVAGMAVAIGEERRRIGTMDRPERTVAAIFAFTALLWVTRPLIESVVPAVSDAGIAVFGGLLMFLVPAGGGRGVLTWDDTVRLPWGVLLLFGGGLSLAAGIADTGLAHWIGQSLSALGAVPLIVLVAATALLVILLTEVTSNTATAAAFIPILAPVAVALGHDPLLLAIPAAVAASCAFMLPVATPPNAIVYASGRLTIGRMAATGLVVNLLMVVVITAAVWLLGGVVFGLDG